MAAIAFEEPFDREHALGHLAARAVPGVERVSARGFRRTLALAHGPGIVELDIRDGGVDMRVLAGDRRDRDEAAARVRRLLGLDSDPRAARDALAGDRLLGPLIAARPGVRVMGCVDGGELTVRAIVNQQVSLAAARTVLGRLAQEHGTMLPGGKERLFPTPDALAALDPATLPMPARRGRALVEVCGEVAAGRIDLRPGADAVAARRALEAVPGIGPWTASYVGLRALADPDAFLPTDLGIRRALAALGEATDRRAVEALSERWRPWRAYAAQQLWASL